MGNRIKINMALTIEVLVAVLIFCPAVIIALWMTQAVLFAWKPLWEYGEQLEKRIKILESQIEELS